MSSTRHWRLSEATRLVSGLASLVARWSTLDPATRGRILAIARGLQPCGDDPPSMLSNAIQLHAMGQSAAAAVIARGAVEAHVLALFDRVFPRDSKPARRVRSSNKCGNLRGIVCLLREERVIDRATTGKFNLAIDVGNAAAHGRPVNREDVQLALQKLEALFCGQVTRTN